jgi:hypothetical protein
MLSLIKICTIVRPPSEFNTAPELPSDKWVFGNPLDNLVGQFAGDVLTEHRIQACAQKVVYLSSSAPGRDELDRTGEQCRRDETDTEFLKQPRRRQGCLRSGALYLTIAANDKRDAESKISKRQQDDEDEAPIAGTPSQGS